MPEVQEVFRMATQKVRQAPGPWIDRSRNNERRLGTDAWACSRWCWPSWRRSSPRTRSRAAERQRYRERPPRSRPAAGPDTMVDLARATSRHFRANIAAVGAYYAVSPDGTRVAYNACCNPPRPSSWRTSTGRTRASSRRRERMPTAPNGPPTVADRVSAARCLDPASRGPLRGRTLTGAIGRSSRISTRHSSGAGGSCSRASRRMPSRSSTSCREATSTTRPGTSGPCRSPAGSRPSCGATPHGATTHRTGGRSRTSHRWTQGSLAPRSGSRASTGEHRLLWPGGRSRGRGGRRMGRRSLSTTVIRSGC